MQKSDSSPDSSFLSSPPDPQRNQELSTQLGTLSQSESELLDTNQRLRDSLERVREELRNTRTQMEKTQQEAER